MPEAETEKKKVVLSRDTTWFFTKKPSKVWITASRIIVAAVGSSSKIWMGTL